MRFNHLRRRGFIALLGAAAVTMWGCLGVLPGSIFLVVIGTTPAATQQRDLDAINKRFSDLYAAGNYAAALVEAKKVEALVKSRFGAAHANYGSALYNLALVYQSQGKYADAEELYQRALAITEKAFGADHPDVVWPLNNLALVYVDQGKYADAEALYKRALAIREKALGAEPSRCGASLNNLASVYRKQGKYADAEGLHKRALAIKEKALGADHPDVAKTLNNLAIVYADQGKYADAEALYKRALAIKEKALGADHPDVAGTLNNLAIVYWAQGKYADAEGLHKRALAIREKALGAEHPDVALTLNNLAGVYARARQVRRRRAALQARAGDQGEGARCKTTPMWPHPSTTWPSVYDDQGRYADAEALYKRALAIAEKALGQDHPDVGTTLNNLARVHRNQGKYADAEPLYKRSLAIREKAFGAVHPAVAMTFDNLAILSASSGNAENALTYSRKATAAVIAHAATETTGAQHKEGAGGLVEQRTDYFVRHVANLAAAAQKRLEPEAELGREAFAMAQWAKQSAAAAAVQQMGLRFAAGTDALAALVRERQDLSAFWRDRDKALLAALSKPQGAAESRRDRRIAQRACCDREQACRQHGAART